MQPGGRATGGSVPRAWLLALLFATPAAAQECHLPTGQWRLDPARSDLAAGLSFDPYYAVSAVDLQISLSPNGSMRQQWRYAGPHLHEVVAYSFRTDGTGQPTGAVSVLDTVPRSISAAWQNCTLLLTGTASLFGLAIVTLNTYVLSAHGGLLTILQHSQSPIGHVSRRLVFTPVGP